MSGMADTDRSVRSKTEGRRRRERSRSTMKREGSRAEGKNNNVALGWSNHEAQRRREDRHSECELRREEFGQAKREMRKESNVSPKKSLIMKHFERSERSRTERRKQERYCDKKIGDKEEVVRARYLYKSEEEFRSNGNNVKTFDRKDNRCGSSHEERRAVVERGDIRKDCGSLQDIRNRQGHQERRTEGAVHTNSHCKSSSKEKHNRMKSWRDDSRSRSKEKSSSRSGHGRRSEMSAREVSEVEKSVRKEAERRVKEKEAERRVKEKEKQSGKDASAAVKEEEVADNLQFKFASKKLVEVLNIVKSKRSVDCSNNVNSVDCSKNANSVENSKAKMAKIKNNRDQDEGCPELMIPEEEVSEFLESQGISSPALGNQAMTTLEEQPSQSVQEPTKLKMSKKYEDILIKLNKKQEEKDVAARELARLEADILSLKRQEFKLDRARKVLMSKKEENWE